MDNDYFFFNEVGVYYLLFIVVFVYILIVMLVMDYGIKILCCVLNLECNKMLKLELIFKNLSWW